MIDLTLSLVGRGWASALVANEDTQIEIVPSYISDAMTDLITAVMLIAEGAAETSCRWQVEPGEYRWFFSCEEENIRVRILEFPDVFCGLEDNKGTLIFTGVSGRTRFCTHVKQQYDRILFKYRSEKYKELWGYDFPLKELKRLDSALHPV
jgi:hypothetical protein